MTYANVVATLALIVAVAGIPSAVAITSKLKKNSVGTKQLKKGSVTANKLARGAVTNPKIADGSVTGPKLTGTRIAIDTKAAGVQADVGALRGRRCSAAVAQAVEGHLRAHSRPSATGWLGTWRWWRRI